MRFIVMGRKSLPDPSQKSRPYWGFVEMVTTKIENVKTALAGGTEFIIRWFLNINSLIIFFSTVLIPFHLRLNEIIYISSDFIHVALMNFYLIA